MHNQRHSITLNLVTPTAIVDQLTHFVEVTIKTDNNNSVDKLILKPALLRTAQSGSNWYKFYFIGKFIDIPRSNRLEITVESLTENGRKFFEGTIAGSITRNFITSIFIN